jgi:hypothetical protein
VLRGVGGNGCPVSRHCQNQANARKSKTRLVSRGKGVGKRRKGVATSRANPSSKWESGRVLTKFIAFLIMSRVRARDGAMMRGGVRVRT